MVKDFDSIYIVLDALDEADASVQHEILSMTQILQNLHGTVVKMFISSREDNQIINALKAHSSLHVSESTTGHDIERYVGALVADRLANHPVILNNPALETDVKQQLVAKAQGM